MQFIIQNRLQSLWPALNRPGCKVWLARCMRMEVAGFFPLLLELLPGTNVGARFHDVQDQGCEFCWWSVTESSVFSCLWWQFSLRASSFGSVLITVTLFRVILTFHKALQGRQATRLVCSCHTPGMPWQKQSAMCWSDHLPDNNLGGCICSLHFLCIMASATRLKVSDLQLGSDS